MGHVTEGTIRLRSRPPKDLTRSGFVCLGLLALAVVLFMILSVNKVTVQLGGKSFTYYTFAPTVKDVLQEVKISGPFGLPKRPDSLTEGETISYLCVSDTMATSVHDGMVIQIYRDSIRKSVEDVTLASPVRRKWDIFMSPGDERVVSPGKTGLQQNIFLSYYRDGKLTWKEKVRTRLVGEPLTRVIASGSYAAISRQGVEYKGKAMRFEATAYAPTGNRTAVGARTRRGIVAVDPKVIPLGTHMFIKGYGYAVAADTGGAIKGRRVDLFFESNSDAVKWGRRPVDIYILEKP